MKLKSILTKMIMTAVVVILLSILSTYPSVAQDTTPPTAVTDEVGKTTIAHPIANAPTDAGTSAPVETIEPQQTVLSSTKVVTPVAEATTANNIAHAYKKMHELLGDRLHIGLRTMTFDLDDDSRVGQGYDNYYLGGIDKLEEVQDSSLDNVTLGFYPIRNFGIEYRYDEVAAKTYNTWTYNHHSDGDFEVDGPIFLAVARLPLDQVVTLFNKVSGKSTGNQNTTAYKIARRFIPYVGIGYADLSGSFDADTWWENGYESPESWRSLGSPEGTIYNGCTREIRVTGEDVDHYFVFGLSILIIDGFYADISYSKVDVDLTADYTFNRVYQYTRTIPMSYSSTSIGLRYYF